MDRWVDKVAVVTGASSGIGAAIAERLVENGLQVAALARRQDRLDELAKKVNVKKAKCFSRRKKGDQKKGKLFPIKTDMTKEEDILNAFKWIKENLGPVHILINNAGGGGQGNLSDGDSAVWNNTFHLNVLGLTIATREAVKDMRANNVDGHIVHINSVAGHIVPPMTGFNVYSASKFAVTALAETLRLELNTLKLKIKITSLSPGLVDTEILPPEFQQMRPNLYKENKIIEAENIADAALFVLSTPPHVQIQELTIRPLADFM